MELLDQIADGADLRLVAVRVDQIKSGSIIIDLFIELYGTYQTSIDRKIIHGIESIMGTDIPPEYEAIVALAVIVVTYFVARRLYDAVNKKKGDPRPSIHIEGDYNTVINIMADRLSITPEQVDAAARQVVHPSKFRQLVKPVVDLLRPAKAEPGTTIRTRDFEASPEAIGEFPNDADIGQLAHTEVVPIMDALIDIRALDKDRNKTGWAARVLGRQDFSDRRLPMDLYPTVDAQALAQEDQVRADLMVEMLRNSKRELVPKRLHFLTFKPVDEGKHSSDDTSRPE